MDFNAFQNLPREEQFKQAAAIAGTDPSVFDGLWRTESGRGANMLGRVTKSGESAEGHFQLMPKTRKVMEGRFGRAIDPYNFGESLYTAAHLMRENMGKFKNLPDALRAYNGGWDKAKWDNPETSAYAAKVLGNDEDGSEAATVAVEPSAIARQPAADLWNTPFTRTVKPPPGAKLNKVSAAIAANAALLTGPAPAPSVGIFSEVSAEAAAADAKLEKEKDETGLYTMARAAAFHEPFNAVAKYVFRDAEPVDPSFVPNEAMLKGKTSDEQKDLRSATSEKQFQRMLNDQERSRDADSIIFKNGTAWGIGATLIAELPAGVLTGFAASAAFSSARISSIALATQGRYAAALTSSTAEGVASNLAITALLDSIGERQGETAYAMAVAGGLLNPLLQSRSLGRAADAAAAARAESARLLGQAVAREETLMNRATAALGKDATPEQIRERMTTLESEDARATLASHKSAIPESRKMNVGEVDEVDEATKIVDELASQAPTARQVIPTANDPYEGVGAWSRIEAHNRNFPDKLAVYGAGNVDELVSKGAGTHLKSELIGDMQFTKIRDSIEKLRVQLAPDLNITLVDSPTMKLPSGAQAAPDGVHYPVAGNTSIIAIKRGYIADGALPSTVVHEFGHALLAHRLAAATPEIREGVLEAFSDFAKVYDKPGAFKEALLRRGGMQRADGAPLDTTMSLRAEQQSLGGEGQAKYMGEFHEWGAEQLVKYIEAGAAGIGPGSTLKLTDQLKQLAKDLFGRLLELFRIAKRENLLRADSRFEDFVRDVTDINLESSTTVSTLSKTEPQFSTGEGDKLLKEKLDFTSNPVAIRNGLDRMPLSTPAERAEAKQVLALYTKAESPEYVVDEKRLSWLLSKVDVLNPTSNIMLRSKNPVVRMVAIELLENGAGAAGRRSTASIAKFMNERAIVGNTIVDMDRQFNTWFKTQQGASHLTEALNGDKRSQFNRLIAEEIEQRRYSGSKTDFGQAVRDAADSVEGSFERARLMQVDAKTNGWPALPESSRGYMPHSIKSSTYRSLSPLQKRALHGELTDQFILASGFDPTFADNLASRYLDRVEHRALGGFDSPMGLHQTGASDIVREALEQMGMTRPEVDAAMKRYTAGGAGYTKKRLNLDLRRTITLEDGSSFRLIDLFDTDMLGLIRKQSQRVSGEVALARHGIMGKPGLAIMRRAMGYGGAGQQADRVAIDAFDQVSSEFLGSPFGVANKNVDRAVQLNSVMSLGGMGFNQLGEQINVGATLGVKAALQNVVEFGRLRAEVLALSRGQKVNNGVLNSIEQFGGAEFGTDAYKMVFPLDNPDLFANSLGNDSLHAGDRLLRGAGHLQSKLSLWRSLHSVQVRGVAEQIVMKASRAMQEGKLDYHLRDMGIDDAMMDRLKKDLPNIAKYQDGKLVEFDITKATDKEAANAFVQGVHRGATQIIQGTFIGESGKYVHNSWLRMMTQFRSFSITAIDKQFNRQLGNRGVMGALMLTLGSMSVAAPIYMARTQLASIGRSDREEYLEKHLSPGAIARATTNYIATSGLGGDFLDAFTSITGTGAVTGGRSGTNTQLIGNMVAPVAGKVDKVWGAIQDTKDGTDVHGLIKELPLSRLPWFIPAVNALD
jgi:hypothetical protein